MLGTRTLYSTFMQSSEAPAYTFVGLPRVIGCLLRSVSAADALARCSMTERQQQVAAGGDDVGSDEDQDSSHISALIGRRVEQRIPGYGLQLYGGTVVARLPGDKYEVAYDDGDSRKLTKKELHRWLVAKSGLKAEPELKSEPEPKPELLEQRGTKRKQQDVGKPDRNEDGWVSGPDRRPRTGDAVRVWFETSDKHDGGAGWEHGTVCRVDRDAFYVDYGDGEWSDPESGQGAVLTKSMGDESWEFTGEPALATELAETAAVPAATAAARQPEEGAAAVKVEGTDLELSRYPNANRLCFTRKQISAVCGGSMQEAFPFAKKGYLAGEVYAPMSKQWNPIGIPCAGAPGTVRDWIAPAGAAMHTFMQQSRERRNVQWEYCGIYTMCDETNDLEVFDPQTDSANLSRVVRNIVDCCTADTGHWQQTVTHWAKQKKHKTKHAEQSVEWYQEVAEAMVKEQEFWCTIFQTHGICSHSFSQSNSVPNVWMIRYSTNIKCVGYDQTLYDKLKERWPLGHTTQ